MHYSGDTKFFFKCKKIWCLLPLPFMSCLLSHPTAQAAGSALEGSLEADPTLRWLETTSLHNRAPVKPEPQLASLEHPSVFECLRCPTAPMAGEGWREDGMRTDSCLNVLWLNISLVPFYAAHAQARGRSTGQTSQRPLAPKEAPRPDSFAQEDPPCWMNLYEWLFSVLLSVGQGWVWVPPKMGWKNKGHLWGNWEMEKWQGALKEPQQLRG